MLAQFDSICAPPADPPARLPAGASSCCLPWATSRGGALASRALAWQSRCRCCLSRHVAPAAACWRLPCVVWWLQVSAAKPADITKPCHSSSPPARLPCCACHGCRTSWAWGQSARRQWLGSSSGSGRLRPSGGQRRRLLRQRRGVRGSGRTTSSGLLPRRRRGGWRGSFARRRQFVRHWTLRPALPPVSCGGSSSSSPRRRDCPQQEGRGWQLWQWGRGREMMSCSSRQSPAAGQRRALLCGRGGRRRRNSSSSTSGRRQRLQLRAARQPVTDTNLTLTKKQTACRSRQALSPGAQLAAVLEHLRGRYCYCLYCGCRYEDADDMQQHCPGPSEGDHE